MPRSEAIALVVRRRHVQPVVTAIRERIPGSVKAVALTLDARLGMRRAAAAYDTLPGLSQSLDRATLRRDARYFARYWFELDSLSHDADVRDFGAYRDYPLYAMQWTHLCFWMTEAVTSLEVARLILERERPSEVILVDDAPAPPAYWYTPHDNWDAAALSLVARRHGVPVTWLRADSSRERPGRPHPFRRCIGSIRSSLSKLRGRFDDRDSDRPLLAFEAKSIGSTGRSVLAIAHGHHYLSQLLPHVLELGRRGHRVILGHHERLGPDAREQLVAGHIDLIDLSRLAATTRGPAWEWKQRSESAFAAADRNHEFRAFFRHRNGIQFWPLVRPMFQTLFSDDIPLTVAHLVAAEEIIESVKPNLLLAGLCEASIDAAYTLAAGAAGTASLGLQHGTILKGHSECIAFASDDFAVWGCAAQRALDRDSHAVVGNADFEQRYRAHRQANPSTNGIDIDPTRPVCLYLGAIGWAVNDVDRYAEEDLFAAVLDLRKALPDLQLIIRLHAGEVTELLREMARERGVDAIIDPKASLQELLELSDVVVSQTTTAGLEAMIAGKPLIYLNIHCERDWLPYAECGAAVGVYEADQLAPAVKRVLSDATLREELARKARQLIAEQVDGLTGDSARRMADLCERTIGERRGETGSTDYLNRMTAFMYNADSNWKPPGVVPLTTEVPLSTLSR